MGYLKGKHKMKRFLLILLALIQLFALTFSVAACSETSSDQIGGGTRLGIGSDGSSTLGGDTSPDAVSLIPNETEADSQQRFNFGTSKSRTIMIYLLGSDLESEGGFATIDLIEMLNSGFDDSWLNILVKTGGALEWKNNVVPDDRSVIYKLNSDATLSEIYNSPIKNMCDPQTLTDFLTFGYENFDTDEYDLIFWNHGAGPMWGFGPDEIYWDLLTLADISEALENSPFDEDNKLGFVGFDACFMSSIEIAYVLHRHAGYMIASQEIEPGWGWNYAFLGNLKPEMSTEEIAIEIIDSYFEDSEFYFAINPSNYTDITLSCLDLSYIPDVEGALNMLFAGMANELEISKFKEFARIRSGTKEFGRSTTPFLFDLVDLVHFIEVRQLQSLLDGLLILLSNISTYVENLIVYNRSNTENANGVSIYYPFTNRDNMEDMSELYKTFGFSEGYTAFMENFIDLLQDDEISSSWDLSRSLALQESDTRIFIQLTPEQVENYASATFYILGRDDFFADGYSYLFSSTDIELTDDGKLYANYSGKMHLILDTITGDKYNFMMKQVEQTETHINYHVGAVLRSWDINRYPRHEFTIGWLQLRTSIDGTDIQALSLILDLQADDSGLMIPRPPVSIYDYSFISLGSYNKIPTYNAAGNLIAFEDWESGSRFAGMEAILVNEDIETFRFIVEDIDRDDEYYIIFSIMDVQGNRYSSNIIPLTFN